MARTHARGTSPFRSPSLLLFVAAALLVLACPHASARSNRGSIVAAAASGATSSGSQALAKLERFLSASASYSTFLSLMKGTSLPSAIVRAINNGDKITILAPTNTAFANYRPPLCGPTTGQVLAHHVLRGYYVPRDFVRLYSKTRITLLPALNVPVGILAAKPVVVGANDVNRANVLGFMAHSDGTIVLHGINKVLLPFPLPGAPAAAADAAGGQRQGAACVKQQSAEAGVP